MGVVASARYARAPAGAAHRRWLFVNALLVSALINAALNAGIAWVGTRGQDRVPVWSIGHTSTLTDLLGTLFVLPFVTCFLVTLAVRRDLRAGRLERLGGRGRLSGLPNWLLLRAAAFGAITFVVLAVPVAVLAIAVGGLSDGTFVLAKACFAVALGALVTPPIALRAMSDRVPAGGGPATA